MNREQSGGGDHPRRPPLRLPVLIVVRSLGIGLGCLCLPILGIQWLADHVCFSKAESEKLHKQSLATIEIKRDKEVNSLLICLEKQIKGGIEAQGTIRCLQEEIASVKVQMQGLEDASLEFSMEKNILKAYYKEAIEQLEENLTFEKNANVQLKKEAEELKNKILHIRELEAENKSLKDSETVMKLSSLRCQNENVETRKELEEMREAEKKASQLSWQLQTQNLALKGVMEEKEKFAENLESQNEKLKEENQKLTSLLQAAKSNGPRIGEEVTGSAYFAAPEKKTMGQVETRKQLEEMQKAEKKASQLAWQLQTQNIALKGVMAEKEKLAANLLSQNDELKEENQKLTSLLQAAKSNGPTIASNGEKVNGSAYVANGQDEMRNNDIIKQNEKHVKEKLLVPNKEISQKARGGENRRIIPTCWGMQLDAPKISFADVAEEEGDDDDLLEEEEEGMIANPTKTRPDSPISQTRSNNPQHAQNKESEHVWVLQKKNDYTLKVEMINNDIMKQNEKHVKEQLLVLNKEISQKVRAGWGMKLDAPKNPFADMAEEEDEGITPTCPNYLKSAPIMQNCPNNQKMQLREDPQHAQNKESESVLHDNTSKIIASPLCSWSPYLKYKNRLFLWHYRRIDLLLAPLWKRTKSQSN